jgi:hypothetical protein
MKRYYSLLWIQPNIRKPAHGLPTSPAWAPGPAANCWAGQAAQRRTLPGLIPARAAAGASPPSIARSTAEKQPADFGGIYIAGVTTRPGKYRIIA